MEDILFGDRESSSSEDDVPIVATLFNDSGRTTACIDVPTVAMPNKKKKQSLWTYEQVAEPTGVTSKYWNADAPPERRTKRVAKQRLSELMRLRQ